MAPDDFAAQLQVLRPLAERGNAQAQYNVGTMYAAGQGVDRDPSAAFHWLQLAADQGYPNAEYDLAAAYANGEGVAQDDAQAAAWTRKAAEQGVAMAQFGLARLYIDGRGLPKDYAQAFAWAMKAAEQGLAEAQFTVAILYAEGPPGVPTDHVRALMWADLSLQRFTASEADRKKVAERDRSLMSARISPAQRAEALKLEKDWLASHHACRPD